MKPIAIYNTDTIAESLAREHGQYPDMFIKSLGAINPALRFARFDVNREAYPESLAGYAGVLITGSQSAAYDSDPWIDRLKANIVDLVEQGVPLVGICFGHQIIHQALGGRVQKAAGGWCVGVHANRLTGAAVDYGPEGEVFNLLSSHQDQVTDCAPGTEILASTARCPVAMTRIGDRVLTFQGHPEFTRDYAQALMDWRRERIGVTVCEAAMASLSQPLDEQRVLHWMLQTLGKK